MDEKLKSCPFCGGKAYIQCPAYGRSYWYVLCDDCGDEGPPALKAAHMDIGEQEAAQRWNTRLISRNDVIEECAQVAEKFILYQGSSPLHSPHTCEWIADAIRARKD